MAIDAQGAEKALPYVQRSGVTFNTLVDETNLLSQMMGFKAVPNCLLVDESGVLQYSKFGGFDIRERSSAELMEGWANGASREWLAERMQEDTFAGPNHHNAIAHFQRGLEYYKQGKVEKALVEWRRGIDLEPDNWVIRKQIWAIEHPERFYDGSVDSTWQKKQIQNGF